MKTNTETATLNKLFAKARADFVEIEQTALTKQFEKCFNLSLGSYLILVDYNGEEQPCMILSVDSVYANRRGNYTARVKVSKLLKTGRMGVGRTLTFCGHAKSRTYGVLGSMVFKRAYSNIQYIYGDTE